MITIVEGNPGSGKSFFGVNYLISYTRYDEMYLEHVLREDVLIIANVEGLRIKHLDLTELIQKYTVEKFFTVENFEKIQKQYRVKNIILLIDEAQKIFDSKFYDKEVFYFFQYHRHLGLDIFLLTQSRTTIARQLIPLCEYIVQAKPRSKGIGGTFSYNYIDPKGSYMYSKTLKASQRVFRAYKSFTVDESNKPKNVLKHYIFMGVAVVAISFACFKYAFSWFKVESKTAPSASSQPLVPVPSPAPPARLDGSPGLVNISSAPAFKIHSSLVASSPQVDIRTSAPLPVVTGFFDAGNKRQYLLSDGRIVTAARGSLRVGQEYSP